MTPADVCPRKREVGWFVGHTRCAACGYDYVSVFPVGTNRRRLECAKCGKLAGVTRVIPPEPGDARP